MEQSRTDVPARVDLPAPTQLAARFPASFRWGTATASYQIEGGAREGGRTPSIWDTFSHTPGKVLHGDTGDVACDHFHRWREDVALMRELGLDTYRLSIAWPRIQPEPPGPDGTVSFNPEGVDFYRRLLDELREAGITPAVTLYHWDLPQWLQDRGGWPARESAQRFGDYAAHLVAQLGERVGVWTTLNEPWCTAYLGYAAGVHAPGLTDPAAALASVHHLNLAHGLAAQAVRAGLGSNAAVSVTLNLQALVPADPGSPADLEAVRRVDAVGNRAFLGPMLEGAYPQDLLADTAGITDWSFVRDGDLATAHQRLDSVGLNYYSTSTVRAVVPGREPVAQDHLERMADTGVALEGIEFLPERGEHTDMGWLVRPDALRETLLDLHRRYPGTPLLITENGAAYPGDEVVTEHGQRRVHDPQRVAYYARHIAAVADAIDAGADVRGYFAWSLLDNFEWSWGYSKRFGIVHVDYATQERTVKDSGRWYADLVAAHRGLRDG